MRNRLTKGAIHRPVIKKGPAAIFLLMTIMFIGSISQTVLAAEVQPVKTEEVIAATTTPLPVKPDTVAVTGQRTTNHNQHAHASTRFNTSAHRKETGRGISSSDKRRFPHPLNHWHDYF